MNGEIKPKRGSDFASLYEAGEEVWALFKGEWEVKAGFRWRSNTVRIAFNLDQVWHRVMKPLPSSSDPLWVSTS